MSALFTRQKTTGISTKIRMGRQGNNNAEKAKSGENWKESSLERENWRKNIFDGPILKVKTTRKEEEEM